MIKNIESDTARYFPSDHFPLNIRMKIKLAKNKDEVKDESNIWKNPSKPNEEEQQIFSDKVLVDYNENMRTTESNETELEKLNKKVTALSNALKSSAEDNLTKKEAKIRS